MLPTLTHRLLRFDELDLHLLYAILRLRSEVFVVEQSSPYLDPDGLDPDALHLCYFDAQHTLTAYARLLAPGIRFPNESAFGRIVVAENARGAGLGRRLTQRALDETLRRWPGIAVRIEAEAYLQSFYESFGFTADSATYSLEGVPHLEMLRPAG